MSRSSSYSRRDLLFGLVNRVRGRTEEAQSVSGLDASAMKGDTALGEGDVGQAVLCYRQCLHKAPEQDEVRAKLGYCHYRQGRYVQAACELTRVLRKHDDNLAALYLGLTQARLGRMDEAVAAFKRYFNPQALAVQREVNLQLALLETSEPPAAEQVVAAIEEAISANKGRGG